MEISSLCLKGFRNFKKADINFNTNTLIIGANDVGKSNMLYALRMLLDKSLSDADIEPSKLDFHHSAMGIADELEITIKFKNITEDAVLSILKGNVSDNGESYIRYIAQKYDLSFKIFIGYSLDDLQEIPSRFYLKYMNLKYIQSQRDLDKYIKKEKRQLLKIAQQNLSDDEREEDDDLLTEISSNLGELNEKISQLVYVDRATSDVNKELKMLAHHYADYKVQLGTGAIQVSDFIDNLQLGANQNGSNVMLGGDGRNNQILLALWKAKSIKEHDLDNEVVFYVIEEPEAHLHPHQQRKLASYLIDQLPGQSIISTHSPQIAVNFKPDSIIRLLCKDYSTVAASDGCASGIAKRWEDMSYRMSILPAETFFSNGVFLVEGPSEILFYNELSKQLNIDLDYENLSILSVDGISFKVYIDILNTLEIPWVMRTDNDISKVSGQSKWQYAGFNRCLNLINERPIEHSNINVTQQETIDNGQWNWVSDLVNRDGIYLSKVDLETDLIRELPEPILKAFDKKNEGSAIDYLQKKKALRMRELLKSIKSDLYKLNTGDLAKPLHNLVALIRPVI
ncbi:ATP-dependent endonuclease [Photobacterium phosphoreum]|uniref:ATP-dependent nuclease n=1 Tax=Photobacterium phosphoreum TaxID=659 RepID=UPI000D15B980|nr:AAA family ATPase [Photobacterium phosphoreum]PSW26174.1 ATP-dependent endonuclease [Photobacterium phosphoreum]